MGGEKCRLFSNLKKQIFGIDLNRHKNIKNKLGIRSGLNITKNINNNHIAVVEVSKRFYTRNSKIGSLLEMSFGLSKILIIITLFGSL